MTQVLVESRKAGVRRGAPARVLLLCSSWLLTRALRRLLEEEGFTVEVACPGRDGDALAAVGEYDAIVLDMKRPGEPALSAVQRWHQGGLRAPLLVLAPPDGPGDLVPAYDWLAKPFDLDDPLARLRALVRSA